MCARVAQDRCMQPPQGDVYYKGYMMRFILFVISDFVILIADKLFVTKGDGSVRPFVTGSSRTRSSA